MNIDHQESEPELEIHDECWKKRDLQFFDQNHPAKEIM